jgi:hypothetical protein
MNSPKLLLVDLGLLAAGATVAICEQGSCRQAPDCSDAVRIVAVEPERMVLVIEGDNLPSAARVRQALAALCGGEATAAVGTREQGWEIMYLPPGDTE